MPDSGYQARFACCKRAADIGYENGRAAWLIFKLRSDACRRERIESVQRNAHLAPDYLTGHMRKIDLLLGVSDTNMTQGEIRLV